MNRFQFFWDTMELRDWTHAGDDDRVLKPVIRYLARQEDGLIFRFDDLISKGLGSETPEAGGAVSPYLAAQL